MSLLNARPLDFDATWKLLQSEVKMLVTDPTVGISNQKFVQCHTYIYKICTIPQGREGKPLADRLYYELKACLETVCKRIAGDLLVSSSLLQLYLAKWNNFSVGLRCVDAIFDYLNRFWIRAHCQEGLIPEEGVYPSVLEMGTAVWRDNVQVIPVAQQMLEAMWIHICEGRKGALLEFSLIREILGVYRDLGSRPDSGRVYDSDFAGPFVQLTFQFYSQEAMELMAAQDFDAYALRAHESIASELAAASRFLLPETLPELCMACERAFIEEQKPWLQSIFEALLLQEDMREQLWRLYALLRRVDGALDGGRMSLFELISREGTAAMVALEEEAAAGESPQGISPSMFLSTFIERLEYYYTLVHESLEDDAEFLSAVAKALVVVVNSIKSCALLLAQHAHSVLDKHGAREREIGCDTVCALTDVVTCLKYVLDKDIFQESYVKLFAQRLVLDSSISQEAEEFMNDSLRSVCSPDFISRLQRMLADKVRSKELEDDFLDEYDEDRSVYGMHVLLLTAGTWPVSIPTPIPIPDCLRQGIEAFEAFYSSKHKGRRLSWMLQLGKAEVRGFFSRTYEFSVSMAQLCVLLAFNSASSLSFRELQTLTGFEEEELDQLLRSLARARLLLRVRTCDGGAQEEAERSGEESEESERRCEETTMRVNDRYSNKKTRVRIIAHVVMSKRNKEEPSSLPAEELPPDRNPQIQAVIVRIMKHRKVLPHSDLTKEVLEHLAGRFVPSLPDIKKNIDILIDKEYMERSLEKNEHVYMYVA
uniref:Cullin family profile domain-containing protein n=1 Tax=Hanusia phi TaxID=3032 RepID=A0A7S0ND92_9CRYP|mmetsp:Transcript_7004/g.16073  ORF Transcript_7004/g.16073 Transcript_7004/m.16073 type:complete len:765 (+) Transcript_7004:133-2427(+)